MSHSYQAPAFLVISAFHFGCVYALDSCKGMRAHDTCERNSQYVGEKQ